MIKNNLFGQVIIVAMVLFLLIGSIQMLGWGVGIDAVELPEESSISIPSLPSVVKTVDEISEDNKKQMIGKINDRPMFSLDRKPFIAEVAEIENPDEELPVSELKAQLTGVVITPEQSYAMILDTLTNQRETYKVGMPLEGEQGGWTLDSIQSRKVVFVSDDNKTEELELAVFSDSMKAGSGGKTKAKPVTPQALTNTISKKDKKKNADDIRKKIAERRAKMRADAAKNK